MLGSWSAGVSCEMRVAKIRGGKHYHRSDSDEDSFLSAFGFRFGRSSERE